MGLKHDGEVSSKIVEGVEVRKSNLGQYFLFVIEDATL